jgi:hypothetical protein
MRCTSLKDLMISQGHEGGKDLTVLRLSGLKFEEMYQISGLRGRLPFYAFGQYRIFFVCIVLRQQPTRL